MGITVEKHKAYQRFVSQNEVMEKRVLDDPGVNDDFKKGFSQGVLTTREDAREMLLEYLPMEPHTGDRKSISIHGHINLLRTLLKLLGKMEVFYELLEDSRAVNSAYEHINRELHYVLEILDQDFQ